MNPLSAILGFAGSLVPVIFPKNEFKPKRLAAVVVLLAASAFMYERYGAEGTEQIIDNGERLVELTEQAK
jgi:hypothetical protein